MPHGSMATIWKSDRLRLPPVTRHRVPARQTSAACMGALPLTRLWVNAGAASRPFRVWANISDHWALVSLLSLAGEPYHVMATRPGSPAATHGNTLAPSPPVSTWTGVTGAVDPLGTEKNLMCVSVPSPGRSENTT